MLHLRDILAPDLMPWHDIDTVMTPHYTIDQAWHSSHFISYMKITWWMHDAESEKFHGDSHSPCTASLFVTAAIFSHSSCLLAAVTLILSLTCLAQFSSWSRVSLVTSLSSPQSVQCPAPSVCRPGRSDRIWTLVLTRLRLLGTCYSAQQLLNRAGRAGKWADSSTKVKARYKLVDLMRKDHFIPTSQVFSCIFFIIWKCTNNVGFATGPPNTDWSLGSFQSQSVCLLSLSSGLRAKSCVWRSLEIWINLTSRRDTRKTG